MAIEERPRVRLHLPDRRRDVRFPERRQRRAREARPRLSGARSREAGPGRRRRRWRRHRHGLQRIQGRHRHLVARAVGRSRAATRSACWCSATTAAICGSSACRSVRRSPISVTCTVLPQPLTRPWTRGFRPARRAGGARNAPSRPTTEGRGSIIVIVATDAPLLPHQLERIARRVGMGLGRLGSWAGNSSGDLFLAFSTANAGAARPDGTPSLTMLPNDRIDPLFSGHDRRDRRSRRQRDARGANDDRRRRHSRVRPAGRSGRGGVEEVQPDEVSFATGGSAAARWTDR